MGFDQLITGIENILSNRHSHSWIELMVTNLTGSETAGNLTPIGPFTVWQRATGQQYTARGILNLHTGEFTGLGINWNQVHWYALDVAVDGAILFVWYSGTRK